MYAIAKVATELFMMVLCIWTQPLDQNETRIDIVGNEGYVDTLIVRHSEIGFDVYDEMNGKLVKYATIRPELAGSKSIFICTDSKGREERIALPDSIPGFHSINFRKAQVLNLKTKDGTKIRLNRSGSIVYLTLGGMNRTYVVH